VAQGPERLTAAAAAFLDERHLATLTSVRGDGSPHVVPVGFTWDAGAGLARVITNAGSVKARLAATGRAVALCQVDGGRWLTLQGHAVVSADPERVAEAVARYAVRYRTPGPNPARVVIEITIDSVLGPATFTAG
jgi:PPOX class probable F420-dependent enzyme